ncbi:hypothetical protein FIBSPDRAFT_95457 [Athelia psychrophila]|uniref:Uncharacterized protein n=1 Tax=Athelia psychrophila TaxID=1759441 RepID=A0A166TQW3_9AGAM|nr:hypothetical protein FIBSPDRAFT_36658 [Fibularhizoctonia sp. CBS 109695]KZP30879.1 hypothetical protein FIBSPDRAFT_95457 [Fibularhizoctonia sp. CBS 109695]
MSLLSPAPMGRTIPPPGDITQTTPLRRRLVPKAVTTKMKAKVKAAAKHDSCVLTWTPAAQCPIEVCYLIPKQAQNGLVCPSRSSAPLNTH